MLQSILVALDGSASDAAATEFGIHLAKRFQARLTGVGVVEVPLTSAKVHPPTGDDDLAGRSHWREERQSMEQALRDFRSRCLDEDVSATVHEDVGDVERSLLHELRKHDLGVLGQHQHSPESASDVTSHVVRDAPRPVIVVPRTLPTGSSVVIGYDASLPASRALMVFATSGLHQSRDVHIVTADADEQRASRRADEARAYLALKGIHAETHAARTDDAPEKVILKAAAGLDAGLLVLGAYGRSAITEFFFGSVTKSLLSHSTIPAFLFH